MRVLLVDSKVSNIKSIINLLDFLKITYEIKDSKFNYLNYDYLILPGVGNFSKFIKNLKSQNLLSSIVDYINEEKYFLGICVGMQFLLNSSKESPGVDGLGLINDKMLKISFDKSNMKVPHIGKNKIIANEISWKNTIFESFDSNETMYFLHSYYCKVNAKYELSKTNYGNLNFTSSVKVKNSYGVQFHPEKSGKKGIEIFKNFLNLKYEKNIKN